MLPCKRLLGKVVLGGKACRLGIGKRQKLVRFFAGKPSANIGARHPYYQQACAVGGRSKLPKRSVGYFNVYVWSCH